MTKTFLVRVYWATAIFFWISVFVQNKLSEAEQTFFGFMLILSVTCFAVEFVSPYENDADLTDKVLYGSMIAWQLLVPFVHLMQAAS